MTSGPPVLVVGELNVDVIVRGAPRRPGFGQVEQLVDEVTVVLGSSSAITAGGLARLGHDVSLAAAVGADTFGHAALQQLRERGVDTTRCRPDPGIPTGATVILDHSGDRALLTALGSIGRTTTGHVGDLPPGVRHVHVGSGFLQHGLLPDLPGLADRAHRAGATVSLDPNYDPTGSWRSLDPVLPHLDLLLVNTTEVTAMAGVGDPRTAAAILLQDLGAARHGGAAPAAVVVKHGVSGAVLHRRDGEWSAPVPPGLPGPVRDTTGAGDSFTAGYLHAVLAGEPPERALLAGVIAGTLSTRGVGGTAGQADADELHTHLAAASAPHR